MFKLLFLLINVISPLRGVVDVTEPGSLERLVDGLQSGEIVSVEGEVYDSFENEALGLIGMMPRGKEIGVYRQIFWDLNCKIEVLENQRGVVKFSGKEAFTQWVLARVGNNESLAEQYIAVMDQRGWLLNLGEGKIGFLSKHIYARLKKL